MRCAGQAAAELVTILGIALVVVLLFFMLSATMLKDARIQQNLEEAQSSVSSLVEAADSVYAQGEGATRKVMVALPGDTVFGSNTTYIGRPFNMPLASQNGININVNGTDIGGVTRASLIGQFPSTFGRYPMRVTSRGAYVEIYPYLVDVDRHSVSIVMAQSEARSVQIVVTRVSGEAVSVDPVKNWGFAGVNLTLSPSSAFGASDLGSALTVSVASGAAASGTYNSQLTLIATGANSGTSETILIPISVDVRT